MKSEVSPTVRVTIEAIRNNIRSGAYRFGATLPPEKTLASVLGVSRGTVRRAIEVLVSTGELKKRLHSSPTIEAQPGNNSARGSEVQVWVSHPIADGASLQFLRGISYGLMGTSYRMVVREPCRFYADFVKLEEREFLNDLLTNENAAGAIIERDPFAQNDDVYAKLVDRGVNLVFVDIAAPAGLEADHVGTANKSAARKCVSHLLEMGHSRIHCVTDTDIPDAINDRIQGYWRGMKQAGLGELGAVIVAEKLPSTGEPNRIALGGVYARALAKSAKYSEWAQRVVREILASDPMPTALFITCDVMAFWVCAYLEGAGVRIPGDLSVVGFDWIGRWDDPANDVLTTASQDFEGFGIHAAELLLDRAEGNLSRTARHLLLPAPMVIRSSTAPDLALPLNPDPMPKPRFYR